MGYDYRDVPLMGGLGRKRKTKGKSFRARLLQICILVALLPITVVSAAFGINSTRIIRSGMEELAASDMVRTQSG